MGNRDPWWKINVAKRQDVLFTDAREGDIIVPVMGPTNAGKSTFINSYLKENKAEVGHGLQSCTAHVQAFCIPLDPGENLGDNRRLVLVDTPGFDDTNQSDAEILRRIAVWLASSYGEGKTCGGLIYLHDMTDARMRGTTLQNLHVFQKLCGRKNLGSVVFATTKSGLISPQLYKGREITMSEVYWNDACKQGASIFKLLPSHQSAVDLVTIVLNRVAEQRGVLLIQKELVEFKKTIPATKAGKELKYSLDEIMAHQKEVLAGGEVTEEEAAVVKAKIAAVAKQIDILTPVPLSLSRRILLFFGLA